MLEKYRDIIALDLAFGIGPATAKSILSKVGSAEDVFRMSRRELVELGGLTSQAIDGLLSDNGRSMERANREMEFIERHNITPIAYDDAAYPKRLTVCDSAPAILFTIGKTDLNAQKILSVVGTRRPTERGRELTAEYVAQLAKLYPDLLVVSGLAYGIDVAAHRAALGAGVPTVGVVAHGLHKIYPAQHRDTAVQMSNNGCVLTEYISGVEPEATNFVARNRIVAAMADATIVVESGSSGGSLITARMARDYGRDVLAVPGSPRDEMSAGCNNIIRDGWAKLIQTTDDIIQALGWTVSSKKPEQGSLFESVESAEQQMIYDQLLIHREASASMISVNTSLPVALVNTLLLEMEFAGKVKSLPGNIYRLLK